MFNDLKRCLLLELKTQITNLQIELEKITDEEKTLTEYAMKLTELHNKMINDDRIIQFEKNYSKISKIFNKGKYLKEKKELVDSIKEEYNTKIANNQRRISEIATKKSQIDNEIAETVQKIEIIEKALDYNELSLSFEMAKELLLKNGINIYDYGYDEILKLGSSIETTKNIEFMKKAINDNPFNIIYDETNDFDMYYNFIESLDYIPKDNEGMETKEFFNNHKKMILEIMQKSKNGEIYIKPAQIVEAIRFYFKDSMLNVDNVLCETDINEVFYRIKIVLFNALELSESDYHELESMYHPEMNDYYCHQTGTIGVEDAIFHEGLKNSVQGNSIRYIGKTARKIDCFLGVVGYHNFYAGNGSGDSRIILEIPKDVERPIGSNYLGEDSTMILPEFVICSLYRKPSFNSDGVVSSFSKAVLHKNTCQDKVQYHYLYENGFDAKNPQAIENPRFIGEDSVKQGLL